MRTLLVATLSLLLASAAGAVDFGSSFALMPNGIGISAHPIFHDSELDMMQAAGVKWIRADASWNIVEGTPGVYDFSSYDDLSARCASRGIKMLYVLGFDNSLYGSDYTSTPWQQGFANYAAALANHFQGKGNIYEVWNEPNLGGMPASTYMAMLNRVSPAMRNADANSAIIGPSLAWNAASGGTTVDTDYLTTCIQSGLLNLCDAVAYHPYRYAQYGPETVVSNYTTIKSLMTTYGGKTLPIVSSEWGYNSTDLTEQAQGDFLARTYLVNVSQNIPLSVWYDLRNDGNDPANVEYNFGVLTGYDVAKPAYNELKLLTKSLAGESFTTKLNDGHSNDWLLVFTGGGHTSLAAWTTRTGGRTVTVSGWGTLHLTATPFYVNPTLLPGDANLDGTVNVQDLAVLAANYRKNVTGGWLQADFNNDGVVDVQDLALLAANYRHSYASDVVPAYGLDAEAIRALSLVGVTVVPEPGALVLLATSLLGLLAYAWRRTVMPLAFGIEKTSSKILL